MQISSELAHILMSAALNQARAAGDRGEVPIGAVLASAKGEILAADGNRVQETNDPTAHAELLVIRRAAALGVSVRSQKTVLVVTIEPCIMCAGATMLSRIPVVIWGASEPRTGGFGSCLDVSIAEVSGVLTPPRSIGGVMAPEALALLNQFFKAKR